MSFPEDPNDLRVQIGFGYGIGDDLTDDDIYTTVSDDMEPRVAIVRGRIGGSSIAPPTQIAVGIKNEDGALSPDNILSPYYGMMRRNTPLRVQVDCGSGWVTRAVGRIPNWSPRWSGPELDRRLDLIASGDDRRIGISRDEATSALTRQLRGVYRRDNDGIAIVDNPVPAAWWPLEDGSDALEAAFGIAGGPPLVLFGSLPLFGDSGVPGSAATVEFGEGGQLRATGLSIPDTGEWGLVWHMPNQVIPDASTQNLIRLTGGSFSVVAAATATTITATVTISGVSDTLSITLPEDEASSVTLTAAQNGADVDLVLRVRQNYVTFSSDTGTLASVTNRPPITARLGADSVPPAGTSLRLCHVLIYDTADLLDVTVADGAVGEPPAVRWARLCWEEGLAYKSPSVSTELAMGPQLPGTTAALMAECVSVAEGFQSEVRSTGELEFYAPSNLMSVSLGAHSGSNTTSSAWLLDYESNAVSVLEPDRDDRDVFNRATVQVPFGRQSAIYEKTDGPLGSSTTTGIGLIADDSISRNVESVTQARHNASALVNGLGTLDAPRFRIKVDLLHSPELVSLSPAYQEWQELDVGDVLYVINAPPEDVGPSVLDLVIDGYIEILDAVEWSLELWCSQRSPYNLYGIEVEAPDGITPPGYDDFYVDQLGMGNQSRIPGGPTLDATYDANDTTFSITSLVRPCINSTDHPSQFPVICVVAGERVRVTAIAGSGLTQTATVERGLDGISKTLPSGSELRLWREPVISL